MMKAIVNQSKLTPYDECINPKLKNFADQKYLKSHCMNLYGEEKIKQCMNKIGLESAKAKIAKSINEAIAAIDFVGLPAIIRPSFTLGGEGGGIAYNKEEFIEIVSNGLKLSPNSEVLIEESLLGWKEFEMEVVRDQADNCIIICSIENIDPMGVHTGDSITVAPALTLTDKEYQKMRNASIAVLREIGVDTGDYYFDIGFPVRPCEFPTIELVYPGKGFRVKFFFPLFR